MHKYSFMTSKCPFLHQDVKLTPLYDEHVHYFPYLDMSMMTTMVKLTACSYSVQVPHPLTVLYYDIYVIWYLSSIVWHSISVIWRQSSVLFWHSPRAKSIAAATFSSDFSVFLVSFYIVIEVPKIMASWSRTNLWFLITTFDLENLDQSMISQPVEAHQHHSWLRVNLKRFYQDEQSLMKKKTTKENVILQGGRNPITFE